MALHRTRHLYVRVVNYDIVNLADVYVAPHGAELPQDGDLPEHFLCLVRVIKALVQVLDGNYLIVLEAPCLADLSETTFTENIDYLIVILNMFPVFLELKHLFFLFYYS